MAVCHACSHATSAEPATVRTDGKVIAIDKHKHPLKYQKGQNSYFECTLCKSSFSGLCALLSLISLSSASAGKRYRCDLKECAKEKVEVCLRCVPNGPHLAGSACFLVAFAVHS